jgi:dTDP-4-dehydrorhamnose reductase
MKKTFTRTQLWAGIECTINRLASGYQDQLELNKHYYRQDDIDAIAELGITTLRYPILWEKHQPEKNKTPDFRWVSTQLTKLQAYNIMPIVGLVHHGSGPEYTNLLDPAFPELLAAYAKTVAENFPWIEMYTPVNEPLTTARFSGLYGFWYPHKQSDADYIQMLLNQLKGTVLAMQEIRKVNPAALLVQTEDLGKTYGSPLLQYQVDLENQRRFYTQDILCGRFTREHPSWNYFIRLGITEVALQFFIDNPCPPNVLGVNYYCTSERYIDEDLHKYPPHSHGGNDFHQYADVEAVRVRLTEPHGFSVLVNELWERYKIPIAITEAHLNCTREGQIKWFLDIYNDSANLKQQGVNILAVTAWSLFGSYGWNKLLTDPGMEYERGIFDVSSGKRRPTAMAGMLKQLAQTGTYNSLALHGEGWWKRDNRFYDAVDNAYEIEYSPKSRPIAIIGKTGTLGQAFARVCNSRQLPHVLLGREDVDIANTIAIENIIKQHNPWAIINAAGYVRVDDAEADSDRCYRENTTGPINLAKECQKHGIQFMTFSSDLVFDGRKQTPYVESDAVNPLNVYGKSKANAEVNILAAKPDSLIIRTSAFFSPWDEYNFVHHVLQTLNNDMPFHASTDKISPTYVPHLVHAALDLLIDEESGIWHLANQEETSWFDFARRAAEKAGLNTTLIIEDTPQLPAKRPRYSALQSEKSSLLPSLETGLNEYFYEIQVNAY